MIPLRDPRSYTALSDARLPSWMLAVFIAVFCLAAVAEIVLSGRGT